MSRFAARFLVEPDLFPARRGGPPWGTSRLSLDLPGGPYRMSGLAENQRQELTARWREWVLEEHAAPEAAATGGGVEIAVERIARGDFRHAAVDFDFQSEFDHAAERVRIAGRWFLATFACAQQPDPVVWFAHEEGDLFSNSFENFLRVLVAYRLLAVGGLLLHSAGFVVDGRGYLGVGRSGAGKSTLTGLAQAAGLEVLSDDLNTVQFVNGQWQLCKLPFAGDFGNLPGRRTVPIAALLALSKAPEPLLVPLSTARAQALLLSCSPFVNRDPFRYDALVREVAAVDAAVPAYELRFAKDQSFLRELQREFGS